MCVLVENDAKPPKSRLKVKKKIILFGVSFLIINRQEIKEVRVALARVHMD